MNSPKLIHRGALAAIVGGLTWALFPLGTLVAHPDAEEPGTLAHQASVAYYWLIGVVPLLLLVAGLVALHALHGSAYGRLGNAGFFVSLLALISMFVGNGWEMATITFRGFESDSGHYVFLVCFLLLLIGSAVLGLAVRRVRRDAASRVGWLLLVGALPLGIVLAVVLGAIAPATDLGFWAQITVPYGLAWVLLGYALFSEEIASSEQDAPRGGAPLAHP